MYCTRCGRELQEGEICTCRQEEAQKKNPEPEIKEEAVQKENTEDVRRREAVQQAEEKIQKLAAKLDGKSVDTDAIKEKSGEIAGKLKKGFLDIARVWKNPVEVTREWVEEDRKKNGLKYMIIKAVLVLMIALCASAYLMSNLGYLGSYIGIPYGSILFLVLVFTIGADLLETVLLDILGKAFHGKAKSNAMFAVVGVRVVYDLTILVATAILVLLTEKLGWYVGGALLLLEVYVEFAAYGVSIDMEESRKIYAYFFAKLGTIAVLAAVSGKILKNVIDLITRVTDFF